jgi:uncharacterized membrane protein YqjE
MATPDSRQERAAPPGFLQSARGYVRTWLDLLRTRLELFSTELEEEEERLGQVLILGVASLLCASLGVLLLTLLIVAAFWETDYRLAVLGALGVIYLAAGIIGGVAVRRRSRAKPKLFSASLGELAKDCQHLSS